MCGGGLVGYLGYELRSECRGGPVSPARIGEPDSVLLVVDRFVAFDHAARIVYVVALVDATDSSALASAGAWFNSVKDTLSTAKRAISVENTDAHNLVLEASLAAGSPSHSHRVVFRLDRDRMRYAGDIAACLSRIADSEGYDLRLTNKARAGPGAIDDSLAHYMALRHSSPAPHAAFVCFGHDLPTLASSSPEKFISVTSDGRARSRPIKGIARRGTTPDENATLVAELRACPKTFAENLMIVDLVRSDLDACCTTGDVQVSAGGLMAVETYAAVHQVVTTVDGRLAHG